VIWWGEFINPELLATDAFFFEPGSVTRLFHIAELKYGELAPPPSSSTTTRFVVSLHEPS